MPPLLLGVNVTRFVPRHTAGAIAIALVVAFLGWASAPPAAAHGELVSSDPPDGGLVEALPSRAVLTFTVAVSEIREITMTGPDGGVVNGEPTSTGREVRQNLWAGPDGAYTMTYDVVFSDGHEFRGEVRFEVGSTSAGGKDGTPDPEAAVTAQGGLWERGRDAMLPVALVLLAGAAALVLLRRQRSGRRS